MKKYWWLAGLLFLNVGLWLWWQPKPPFTPPEFRLGVHLLMTGRYTDFPRSQWGEHLRYTRQMTGDGGWVVQVVQLTDLDVPKWQAFLDDCFALGLRPVLRLGTATGSDGHWSKPEADPDGDYDEVAKDWADFFAALTLPEPVWVTIGNEPNSGGEWGGQANPHEYATYFVSVAAELRKLDQPLYLAAAALDLYAPHTNFQPFPNLTISMMDAAAFYDSMFAAQPRWMDYVDFWVSHPYPIGPFKEPPWVRSYQIDRINGAENLPLSSPPAGITNRGINGYEWEIWYLETHYGVNVPPILITEFGYRHNASIIPHASDGMNAELDTETAAAYTDMALWGNLDGRYPDAPRTGWKPLTTDPRIMGVAYFGLAGNPRFWGHTNLLIVDELGRVIGTYPTYDRLLEQAD